MNNLTFGDEHIGYYETIAGGAGLSTPSSTFVDLVGACQTGRALSRRWATLARTVRCAHTHDEHPYHRPGGTLTATTTQ